MPCSINHMARGERMRGRAPGAAPPACPPRGGEKTTFPAGAQERGVHSPAASTAIQPPVEEGAAPSACPPRGGEKGTSPGCNPAATVTSHGSTPDEASHGAGNLDPPGADDIAVPCGVASAAQNASDTDAVQPRPPVPASSTSGTAPPLRYGKLQRFRPA